MGPFKALRIHNDENGYRATFESLTCDDLSPGEVVVKTAFSSVNYKDALAGTGRGKILRQFPLIGGIDIAGEVVESQSSDFSAGDHVLMTGCGLSETRDGGYSEYQRLPASEVIPLPEGLTLRESMGIGTAGFTAALCLFRMEANGQTKDMGPVVVTGATGGVGMIAVSLLSHLGYDVHAITGKTDRYKFLQDIGATQCHDRNDLSLGMRPMERGRWAGAIDNVGGDILSGLTRCIGPWGSIASVGLAGGVDLSTTVMPFIIRGVSLLGISSANCPMAIRRELWQRLATSWKPPHMEKIVTKEIAFDDLSTVFEPMLNGEAFGRTVVKL